MTAEHGEQETASPCPLCGGSGWDHYCGEYDFDGDACLHPCECRRDAAVSNRKDTVPMMADTTVTYTNHVGIRAKYVGPTNSRGTRIVVHRSDVRFSADSDHLSYAYRQGASLEDNITAAVEEYLKKKGDGWQGKWAIASTDDTGYVAVWVGP